MIGCPWSVAGSHESFATDHGPPTFLLPIFHSNSSPPTHSVSEVVAFLPSGLEDHLDDTLLLRRCPGGTVCCFHGTGPGQEGGSEETAGHLGPGSRRQHCCLHFRG